MMSIWRFILRSLAYHWRIHLAVALGVAAATAVLTGRCWWAIPCVAVCGG